MFLYDLLCKHVFRWTFSWLWLGPLHQGGIQRIDAVLQASSSGKSFPWKNSSVMHAFQGFAFTAVKKSFRQNLQPGCRCAPLPTHSSTQKEHLFVNDDDDHLLDALVTFVQHNNFAQTRRHYSVLRRALSWFWWVSWWLGSNHPWILYLNENLCRGMGPIAPGPSQHMMVSPQCPMVRLSKCMLIWWAFSAQLGETRCLGHPLWAALFFWDCMLACTDALFLHAGGRCFLRQNLQVNEKANW